MNVKDWGGGAGTSEEMEIVGVSLTWPTRMRLPSEGEMEGKVTESLTLGVKVVGIIVEGRRFALRSEARRVVVSMMRHRWCCVFLEAMRLVFRR
jgi:hypothetical protein